MIGAALDGGRGAVTDAAALWLVFLSSPAAPQRAMSLLELDGYLTGVILAPSLIAPSRWMAGLWIEDEPVFDDPEQIQMALNAVGMMFSTLSGRIDRSLRRLETERICDYRPAFQINEGKPSHEAIRIWVSGFCKAMALAPTGWSALAEDERLQPIFTPLVGFIEVDDPEFEPADDIEERLDDAAAQLPRTILLLRKIAQLRASRPSGTAATRRTKVGRNDPCPCGSGKKFKHCCGPN
jgi:uncharacterized protein